jgi:hypothetical protein
MSPFEIYLCGALSVSSVLMWWFTTNLQIHVFQVIKFLGYKKNDPSFWDCGSGLGMEFWTKIDCANWMARVLPGWLGELLSCPGCLSMHVSLWLAAFFTVMTWHGWNSVVFFFLAWGGWPFLANVALATLEKIKSSK